MLGLPPLVFDADVNEFGHHISTHSTFAFNHLSNISIDVVVNSVLFAVGAMHTSLQGVQLLFSSQQTAGLATTQNVVDDVGQLLAAAVDLPWYSRWVRHGFAVVLDRGEVGFLVHITGDVSD